MRGLDPGDDYEALLAGFIVGGAGIGVISPALAAAMVGVLPVERSGLSSGINNTFRQLGIASGHRRPRRDLPAPGRARTGSWPGWT